ncbi:MAG: aminopeptidase P family protein [Planctomycetaceae bacterium]|nr:aminopeptidase P family protein [Planctomycetaceae bacterium]
MPTLDLDRISRLQKELVTRKIDAFFASTAISMGYLAGFYEGGYERFLVMAIPAKGEPALICPALSVTHAQSKGIKDIRGWRDGENAAPLFAKLVQQWKLHTAAADDDMPASYLLTMQETCPELRFVKGGDVIGELRRAKSKDELAKLRHAADVADKAQLELQRRIKPGMKESECAVIIRESMTKQGCSPTFCIVAAGAYGAEPHHATSDYVIKNNEVVIVDCGCLHEKYNSDTTRTFCVGKASDEARKVYEIVYRAYTAGCDAVRPGVPCEDVDAAARKVIEDAGYGEYFMHRTGHGIGVQGHEPPYIVKGSKAKLVVGQCFSVEPGIYLPGKFGVRIENIVSVGETGCDSLNCAPPPELIEIG